MFKVVNILEIKDILEKIESLIILYNDGLIKEIHYSVFYSYLKDIESFLDNSDDLE